MGVVSGCCCKDLNHAISLSRLCIGIGSHETKLPYNFKYMLIIT